MKTLMTLVAAIGLMTGAAYAQNQNAPGQPTTPGTSGAVGEKESYQSNNPAAGGPTNRPSTAQGQQNAPGQPTVPSTTGAVGDKESYPANNPAKGPGTGGPTAEKPVDGLTKGTGSGTNR